MGLVQLYGAEHRFEVDTQPQVEIIDGKVYESDRLGLAGSFSSLLPVW